MAIIQFPSGQQIDFGDLSQDEITSAVNKLGQDMPELFESAPETITPEPSQKPEIDFRTATFEEATRAFAGTPQQQAQKEKLTLPEIKDKSFRFSLGMADSDEEKLGYIQDVMGSPDAVFQDADGSFIIDQSKVTPEAREEFDLSDNGLIYANKPGFTWSDTVQFLGAELPSLVAGIGASVAVAGTGGLIVPMIAVGAATGAGRAAGEAVEFFRGYNKQSLGDVGSAIVRDATLGALGEGGGRVVTNLLGRFFKGRGPQIREERLRELDEVLPSGLRTEGTLGTKLKEGILRGDQAKKAAYEEARADMNDLIRQGAVPSISAATDKELVGTLQSINEMLLGGPGPRLKNTAFVRKKLDDFKIAKGGRENIKQQLLDNYKEIADTINVNFIDEKTAVDQFKKKILPTLDKQMDNLVKNYNPSTGIPSEFEEAAKLTTSLYTQATRKLYNNADNLLGKQGEVDALPILKALDEIQNPFLKQQGGLITEIKNQAALKGNKFNFSDLQQMKEALRIARGDSELIATGEQYKIDKILNAIEETKVAKHEDLLQKFVQADGKVSKENKNIIDGLNRFKEANKAWADGQEIFNKAGINTIVKDAKGGKFVANQAVLDLMQRNRFDSSLLKQYLDAVEPPETVKQFAFTQDKVNALSKIQNTLNKPNITAQDIQNINKTLRQNNLSKYGKNAEELPKNKQPAFQVPEIADWLGKITKTEGLDATFKNNYINDYRNEINNYLNFARGGLNPSALRENVRDALAKKWLQNTRQKAGADPLTGAAKLDKFADEYFQLDKGVRSVLFGKDNIAEMDDVVKEFALLSRRNSDEILQSLPQIGTASLRKQIGDLKEQIKVINEADSRALRQAISTGDIFTNSDAIVSALLKNPESYKSLVKKLEDVGPSRAVKGVGGLEDMVMENILREPLEKLSALGGEAEVFVQSGRWGKSLQRILEDKNKNKALNVILGDDKVAALNKFANDAVKVSDALMPGAELAGKARKVATALAIFAGIINPANLVAAGLALAPAAAANIAFRSKLYLNLVTKPRLRASEFEKLKKAGVEFKDDKLAKELAKRNLRDIIGSATGVTTALTQSGATEGVTDFVEGQTPAVKEFVEEQSEPFVEPTKDLLRNIGSEARSFQPQASTLNLPDTGNFAPLANQQPRPVAPGMGTGEQLLAAIEREKALGLRSS